METIIIFAIIVACIIGVLVWTVAEDERDKR